MTQILGADGKEVETAQERETERPRIIVNDRRHWARDDDEDEDSGPRKPSYVEELEAKVADAEETVAKIKTQHKEALEEFENARARLRREVDQQVKQGTRQVLTALLEVMDNLDRAAEAADAPNADEKTLRGGVKMVRDQFLRALDGVGVTRVSTLGKAFDPSIHEAISQVPVNAPESDGIIVGEIKGCYRFDGELLRPAVVAVGKHSASGE